MFEEREMNLFLRSLIGTTIQDGSIRESILYNHCHMPFHCLRNKNQIKLKKIDKKKRKSK